MTKQTFNIGKWYTIVWLGLGSILMLSDWITLSDGEFMLGLLITIPTVVWLFQLKIATEEKEEIEINVK